MSDFTYISTFSGLGFFEKGLDSVGGQCVFASELDEYARQGYKALHNIDTLHGDITQINIEDIPDADLLVGGFPCQSFSRSGKQLGFNEARGTLVFELLKIAKEKQPKIILAENVKGIVNHDSGNTLDTIIKAFSEIGYRVDFTVLNSKDFDTPQSRERFYLVAVREDLIENERWNIVGSNVVAKGKRRISEYEDVKTFNFDFPTGVNKSEIDLWDIIDYGETDYFMKQESADKIVARLDSETMQASYSQPVILHNIYGGFKEKKPRVFLNYSPTIRTSKGGGHIPSWLIPEQHTSGVFTLRIRKLSPLECFKLQGLSEEDFDKLKATGLSDTQLYKMAGNAVSIPVIEHIGLKIKELLKHNLIKE